MGGFSGSSISGDKTEDTLGSIDYWVIKLSPDTITSIHNNITANSNTITLHPNPASQFATLDYSSINENIAALSITNMLGERIAFYRSLPPERLQIQTSTVHKGIYVIELRTQTKVIQKKMVVQ